MKYIIDEEELRKLPQYTINTCDEISVDDAITELIKHKQPVEMVASGEITQDKEHNSYIKVENGTEYDLGFIGQAVVSGKKYEIYIKECEE